MVRDVLPSFFYRPTGLPSSRLSLPSYRPTVLPSIFLLMRTSPTARRTHGFTESVIRSMTRLANEHGAINLAQGFPNFPCPDVLKEAAVRAIQEDVNQYAITWGAA